MTTEIEFNLPSETAGKPLRILVVHEVSYNKKPIYEYQDFPERLARLGHDVTVIDFDENGDGQHRVSRTSRTKLAEIVLENTPHNDIPVLKYLSGKINYGRMLKKKLADGSFDAVLLYSVFINGTSTIRLCQQYKVPVVYRVLDAYHLLRKDFLSSRLLLAGERYIYKNASALLVTNEKLRDYVFSICPEAHSQSISVVNHGVDDTIFFPRPRDRALAQTYGIEPSDRVAVFLGTTYPFSGLDVVIDQFELIRAACPTFKLLIVGAGEMDGWLQSTVAARHLGDRIILTGMIPYEQVPQYLSLADVALNPFQINAITRNIIPIKILQYLSSGLPVLSTPLEDLAVKFPEGSSGMVYANIASPELYAKRLIELLQQAGRRSELSAQGLHWIKSHYSINTAVRKVEQSLYDAIASA